MQLDFGGWLWDETDRRARINRKTDAIMTKLTADYPCFFAAVTLLVGTWLSLVEHSLGVRGVGSSNLPVPTISFFSQYFLLSNDCVEPTHECYLGGGTNSLGSDEPGPKK